MPQLDIITFSSQVALNFWLMWSLHFSLTNIVFPQYLIFNYGQKFLWKNILDLIFLKKKRSMLSYLELINCFNKHYSRLKMFLKHVKNVKIYTTKFYLKKSLKKNRCKFYLHFLQFSKIFLIDYKFERKNKFNFLRVKKSIYFFVQTYNQLKIFLKIKFLRVLLKQVIEFRLKSDEVVRNIAVKKLKLEDFPVKIKKYDDFVLRKEKC